MYEDERNFGKYYSPYTNILNRPGLYDHIVVEPNSMGYGDNGSIHCNPVGYHHILVDSTDGELQRKWTI